MSVEDLVKRMRDVALENSYDPERRPVPEECSQIAVFHGREVRLCFSHSEFPGTRYPAFYSLTVYYEDLTPMDRKLSDSIVRAFFPHGVDIELTPAQNTVIRQFHSTTEDRARRRV